MEFNKDEYLFLFNGNSIRDKEARGYALTLDNVAINDRNLSKDPLTPKQIAEVADKLNIPINQLLKDADNDGMDFSDDQIVELLAKDPSKMKTPIILSQNTSFLVSSPYEMINEKIGVTGIKNGNGNKAENTKELPKKV